MRETASRSSAVSSGEYSATTPAKARAAGPLAVAGAADAVDAAGGEKRDGENRQPAGFHLHFISSSVATRDCADIWMGFDLSVNRAAISTECAVHPGQGGPSVKRLRRSGIGGTFTGATPRSPRRKA